VIPPTVAPTDVRAHLERICDFRFFRGRKLRELLTFLVEEWLKDGGKQLTLRYIAGAMGEPETIEQNSGKKGFPKTRGNLGHVRVRLKRFNETEGYRDRVIVKLNPGSYVPEIGWNPISSGIADLDPTTERLIQRAKTAIDKRTLRGAIQASQYADQISPDLNDPRQIAALLFLEYAAAPLIPSLTCAALEHAQPVVDYIKKSGVEPWEITFVEACSEACGRHEWQKANVLFESAIINSLGEAKNYWWYTALLACLDRAEEAVSILEASVRHFSRTNLAVRADLADMQTLAGRFADAEEILLGSLDFAPANDPRFVFSSMLVLEAQDKLEEAAALMDQYGASFNREAVIEKVAPLLEAPPTSDSIEGILSLNEGHLFLLGLHVLILGRLKQTAVASDTLNFFMNMPYGQMPPVELAIAMIGVGRFDEAVALLRKAAFEAHDPYSMWFHIFPPFRHLKEHPGYQELLKDLKLPRQRKR